MASSGSNSGSSSGSNSGSSSLEVADTQRRHALRKAESSARALAAELASLQEYYGRLGDLRSDLRQAESQIRGARFSIGRLCTELQHSLREFSDADSLEARGSLPGGAES